MAVADLVPRHITTAIATLPSHSLLDREINSKNYAFAACAEDADGPCQLSKSSSAACERRFATVSGLKFNQLYYCMCTNGYYERSSECWVDCYGGTRTTPDQTSISRKSRQQELACESYSLGIESELAFNSAITFTANKTYATASTMNSKSIYRGATVGATASANVEETAPWVERPTAVGSTQHNSSPKLSAEGTLAGAGGNILILLLLLHYMLWYF